MQMMSETTRSKEQEQNCKSMLQIEHWKRKHRDKMLEESSSSLRSVDHRRSSGPIVAPVSNTTSKSNAKNMMPIQDYNKMSSQPSRTTIQSTSSCYSHRKLYKKLQQDLGTRSQCQISEESALGNDNHAKTTHETSRRSEIILTRLSQLFRSSTSNNQQTILRSQLKQQTTHRSHLLLQIFLLLLVQGLLDKMTFVKGAQSIGATADQQQASSLHNNVGDPRPTIYSGQISFGLLLSAHSSLGAEIVGSASHQIQTIFALEDQKIDNSTTIGQLIGTTLRPRLLISSDDETSRQYEPTTQAPPVDVDYVDNTSSQDIGHTSTDLITNTDTKAHQRSRRQIFNTNKRSSHSKSPMAIQHCSQVNPNALYAGMGAIWASHQANLVADSHFTIGTYVYDSCNDADVGQRQSVRIVSNLNAFQQTTCESPRGSPISLTIAHGDDQVKAIHLLTSFRVPVISTKEHFAQEAYAELNNQQKRYLFSTAPSSRHLALGALRFARRVAAKSASSPKLPNRLNRSSSRNGLVVISRDLPPGFISYLAEVTPKLVNYELLVTKLPIDQISSVQRLESIFMKSRSTSSQQLSESRLSSTRVKPSNGSLPLNGIAPGRLERRSMDADSAQEPSSSSSQGDSEGNSDSSDSSSAASKMLSPTILMFITPAEAIDLITRLRNNMAEVSKYYSLIIVTREDITPALKTIFQRGGSSLCSGKAFYTVSPKPDDMSEFSRYFRDTVHIEGETSDHPLICEYAKHASSSRIATDYDDVAAEPVIKAVWAAAAAFKQVHSRECGNLASSSYPLNGSNFYKNPAPSTTTTTTSATLHHSTTNNPSPNVDLSSGQQQHQQASRSLKTSRQSATSAAPSGGGKSAHSECMMKMSKSMSQLVQKALKKINVSINSTGLQSLDGFQVSFDELNELNSNKFSIRHINKECEIEEIGQYTGLKSSQLHLDNGAMLKSLESTLPDAWPVTLAPTPVASPEPTSSTASSSSTTNAQANENARDSSASAGADGGTSSDGAASNPSWLGEQPASTSTQTSRRKRPPPNNHQDQSDSSNSQDYTSQPGGDEETTDSSLEPSGSRHKTSKRSRSGAMDEAEEPRAKNRPRPAPIRTTGGRAHIGITDAPEHQLDSTTNQVTTNAGEQHNAGHRSSSHSPPHRASVPTGRPMRKLMPYPTQTEGTKLKDWIPREDDDSTTTLAPTMITMPTNRKSQAATATTSKAPLLSYHHSTLPESGGNTDLEIPALATTRWLKSATKTTKAPVPSATVTASESSEVVTLTPANKHPPARKYVSPGGKSSSVSTRMNATGGPSWASSSTTAAPHSDMNLNGAATTVSSVTLKPFGRQGFSFDTGHNVDQDQGVNQNQAETGPTQSPFRDLDIFPVALSSEAPMKQPQQLDSGATLESIESEPLFRQQPETQKFNRSRLRSHLRRIYNSWFGLVILVANILGAILTLYVLTFLLMKNCDGSLDRENQNVRSMHLLAIIVLLFGSTLFIVSPTPGLCLLRASWHNFALVLLFGCLLSQSMQTRSLRSLGLGGRPNRLNQLLNLIFLVGVQVSFELQRWKYESANYLNFVNQYFGSPESDHKKLMILGNAIANQFNPLDSFNDLVTPVSIQVSEKYQNLLQDYCIQQTDDFMQSQIYPTLIVLLSILFACLTRNCARNQGHTQGSLSRSRFFGGGARRSSDTDDRAALAAAAATMTSGKLVASEHEANLNISSGSLTRSSAMSNQHHSNPFGPSTTSVAFDTTTTFGRGASFGGGLDNGMVFIVTLVNAFIYGCSLLLLLYGQNQGSNRDLISSITMLLIAFVTLIGVFFPIIYQLHQRNSKSKSISDHSRPTRPLISSCSSSPMNRIAGAKSKLGRGFHSSHSDLMGHHRQLVHNSHGGSTMLTHQTPKHHQHHLSGAFAMFPEFSPTGLKRPSSMASLSDDRSSGTIVGSSSRRPLAEREESRRKMGFNLANLASHLDAHNQEAHQHAMLHDVLNDLGENQANMRFYEPDTGQLRDSSLIHEALLNDQPDQHQKSHNHSNQTKVKGMHRLSKGQLANGNNANANGGGDRLITCMLDVDPCCPKHGIGARQNK